MSALSSYKTLFAILHDVTADTPLAEVHRASEVVIPRLKASLFTAETEHSCDHTNTRPFPHDIITIANTKLGYPTISERNERNICWKYYLLLQIGMTEEMAKALVTTEIAQAYDLQKLNVRMQQSIKDHYEKTGKPVPPQYLQMPPLDEDEYDHESFTEKEVGLMAAGGILKFMDEGCTTVRDMLEMAQKTSREYSAADDSVGLRNDLEDVVSQLGGVSISSDCP
ncbi:uncharacterized protein EV420DRAFT_1516075 [Desarmillaria tabescens]|uniref:Uncharacterized protein n=1 Tax=Armillaria tabescens TaxID=1929756 RepID=A0AA39T4M0_ARMTA|nr:uncharacterized protein EV420DRAFT_1516075 [Desarmillaria tabescens]KAK0464366.1 hypothetical protein EV420DRAFT_1516075 [Desarmillaria tabescens]